MHPKHVENRYEKAIALAAELDAKGVAASDAQCMILARHEAYGEPSVETVAIVVHILRCFQAARDLQGVAA